MIIGGIVTKFCPTVVNTWPVAHQALLSMEFPRQEYWSVLPFPFLGDLPDPGIKLAFPALACEFFTAEPPGKSFISCWEFGSFPTLGNYE